METKHKAIVATYGLLIAVSSAHASTLEVDAKKSRIQVDAKATGHAFTGDLITYSIKAAGNEKTHVPSELSLSWDFNSLKTGDVKRDKEMIKWLGGGKPAGAFKLVKTSRETPQGGNAEGLITINGVSKSITFPYTVKQAGEWLTLDGTATLDYQTFKLPMVRSMLLMKVNPVLSVRFHVVGKLN
jgi:polyisoprenoid-binding protein YceI